MIFWFLACVVIGFHGVIDSSARDATTTQENTMNTTANDFKIALKDLSVAAAANGLIPAGTEIKISHGSKINGHAGYLYSDEGHTEITFVPPFKTRYTRREQMMVIEAASYALFAAQRGA